LKPESRLSIWSSHSCEAGKIRFVWWRRRRQDRYRDGTHQQHRQGASRFLGLSLVLASERAKAMTLLREMVESEVIQFGETFNKHFKETGQFDLSKVDMSTIGKSKVASDLWTDD
jgi:hypothetical protein